MTAGADSLNREGCGAEQAEEGATGTVIPVLLADSVAIYRLGMRKIFELKHDIRVVAEVDSATGLHAAVESFSTAVIILDDTLINGMTKAIPELLRRAPNVKIIVQTMASDKSNTVELYRRGVRGVTPRSISAADLLQCVRKVAAGDIWITNQAVNWIIDAVRSQGANHARPGAQPTALSAKELAIITCVTQAKKNKEIADQLGTSEQMIKNYLCKVYGKLGVSDRLELAIYCENHDIHKQPFVGDNGGPNVYPSAANGNRKANGDAHSFVMAPKT